MTFDVQVQEWIEVALAVHALASVIVAATPTPKDDAVFGKFYTIPNPNLFSPIPGMMTSL